MTQQKEYVFTEGLSLIIIQVPEYEHGFQQEATDLINELIQIGLPRKRGVVYLELIELVDKIEDLIRNNEIPFESKTRFVRAYNELNLVPKLAS